MLSIFALMFKDFGRVTSILILVSEGLQLLWHLLQFFLLIDSGERNPTYSNTFVWFLCVVIFFAIMGFMVIEIILISQGINVKYRSEKDENLNSEDLVVENESNDDVNNKMRVYQSMKRGVPPPEDYPMMTLPGDTERNGLVPSRPRERLQMSSMQPPQPRGDSRGGNSPYGRPGNNVQFDLGPNVDRVMGSDRI